MGWLRQCFWNGVSLPSSKPEDSPGCLCRYHSPGGKNVSRVLSAEKMLAHITLLAPSKSLQLFSEINCVIFCIQTMAALETTEAVLEAFIATVIALCVFCSAISAVLLIASLIGPVHLQIVRHMTVR